MGQLISKIESIDWNLVATNMNERGFAIIPKLISDNQVNVIRHIDISDIGLRSKLRAKKILYAGNLKLKIYGRLNCKSGKRMKSENRVFFTSENDALKNNFRPCGHCMKSEYQKWKDEII